ncbi:AAA family ATPase [Maritimibacter sp. DP1N21-5]|uniref:AAA family ATPase n=1 Tax=Maritimibacter sp. DP1N21-5 TaxID=2836867 RepID=UPI001C48CA68|nr:AAA family ATPase [Maritimibacter sp. DP1N21-5]MBV7407989.1 AAA family ATPase [Maritimibacter sp. DP1N21-5]
MDVITEDQLADLVRRAARGRARYLVAIAGAPGSGKSTLAERLAQGTPRAQAIPMDGFHHDNDWLNARNLYPRKGAPETFDAETFVGFVHRLAHGEVTHFPTFDRAADATLPTGGTLAPDTHVYLIEGNYLLLDEAPWSDCHPLFDLAVVLDVPEDELERRLVARWRAHGHAEEDAVHRAHANDLPNGRIVRERSIRAAFRLSQIVT